VKCGIAGEVQFAIPEPHSSLWQHVAVIPIDGFRWRSDQNPRWVEFWDAQIASQGIAFAGGPRGGMKPSSEQNPGEKSLYSLRKIKTAAGVGDVWRTDYYLAAKMRFAGGRAGLAGGGIELLGKAAGRRMSSRVQV